MINAAVSVKNAILEAQVLLGIDHDKDLPALTTWAVKAEDKIGAYQQYERTKALLTIEGCSACLPTDAVLTEIAILGDYTTNCNNLLAMFCGTQAITNVNLDGQANFLVIDVGGSIGDTTSYGTLNYYIQNNKLIFDTSSFDGKSITVQYLRLMTDCDGIPLIGQNHIDAIKWYVVWNYYIRNGKKNYIDRDMISMAERQWEKNCANARAEDGRMTYPERQEAARLYSNPLTGRGIWQGMYTTLGNSYYIW